MAHRIGGQRSGYTRPQLRTLSRLREGREAQAHMAHGGAGPNGYRPSHGGDDGVASLCVVKFNQCVAARSASDVISRKHEKPTKQRPSATRKWTGPDTHCSTWEDYT